MAALVLGVVGSAIGSSIGGTVLGLTAAQVGGFIGATIGQQIDGALFSRKETVHQEGPRLSDINLTASTEGAPIPRIYGRTRLGGQLIWAARFKETATTDTQTTGGGKGFGGGGGKTTVETTTYTYSISFAVGLSEGIVTRLGRVWADGKLLDLSKFTTRFYAGSETQDADPLIQQIEGAANVPAFRGLSYIVFEDMPLAEFGNRIPQLQFEVLRALHAGDATALDNVVQGVALIPGSGEFVLATSIVRAEDGYGGTTGQNKNNNLGVADFEASLDQLEALLPNCKSVVLVLCWFGDDLRCGQCAIKPKVEVAAKSTAPLVWSVDGIARENAAVVSVDGAGRPVFGGTPADASVVEAIQELKARGFAVHVYPFLLMDIPSGNAKPDPYGGAEQAAFPWRGRITCDPAPGHAGTVDKTAAAATQVAAFFGNASAANYSVSGTTVSWTGGADWGYRRMVLHYAKLCAALGGVDSFLLGSELEGLTKIRSSASAYPTVTQLKTLAADVKAILPAAKVSYAANWTEYANHRPADGTGDVFFHLDPLWADSHIDFVAIDNYLPSSDWRDGDTHLDYADGRRITDKDYLDQNVEGGEHFDWFYADQAARDAQTRSVIADSNPANEPWVFRYKDIHGWWANAHHDRPGGVRNASATAWAPQSKPIWFTELGCPAVDRGSNQPNVFVDAKSSESALPYYSRGTRDDLIQRRALEAAIDHWAEGAHNPVSATYGGRMIPESRVHVWCWDARSFPDFPARASVWTDAGNWRLGHWLNGRVGLVMLADLVADLAAYGGFADIDVSGLFGLVTGFVVERTMSVREALEPLMLAYQFDAYESEGLIKFAHRGGARQRALSESDLVMADGDEPKAGFKLTRAQESELPLASRLGFIDAAADYRQTAVESRRLVGASERTAVSTLPVVMEQSFAQGVSDAVLMDAWVARERAGFALAPSELALDATDIVTLNAGGRDWRLRLTEIADAGARRIAAERTDPSVYELIGGPDSTREPAPVTTFGKAYGVFLDLPLLTGTEIAYEPYFAAYATPWPGAVLLYRAAGSAGFALDAAVASPSTIGFTDGDFYSGPLFRFDRVNELYLTLIAGTLASKSELEVLNGANALALENEDGAWEIVQFTSAELLAPRAYKLTGLLRGQAGTESAMRDPVRAGARVVVLNRTLVQPGLTFDQRTLTFTYRYGPAGEDFSDPAFVEETRSFEALGLRPLAPAQLRGRRNYTNGDWTFTWQRRTRVGGDDWAQTEVPLGEESEAYEIEIYDLTGATLKRTLSASTPSVLYTASQQTSDFGAAQWNVFVRCYQLSAAFGRGAGAEALVWHH
jgi:hypothetical protein